MSSQHIAVVGGGIFGLTAALELDARGHRVSVLEPGPIPHPLAASTDISKVIRMEYGSDEAYMALTERAIEGWRAWNERWSAEGTGPLYHETGVLMISQARMTEGGFEHESYKMLLKRGHAPERMDAETIALRFPAWSSGRFVDGFFHATGGYAESGKVVEALARMAEQEGIALLEGREVESLINDGGRVTGARDQNGEELSADEVVIAAGAWTGKLVPELAKAISATGHPIFHLKPAQPELFEAERFPTFTADVARTGYYGFPINGGVVKIANHGLGTGIDPDAPRSLTMQDEQRLRSFLGDTFPALAEAEIVYTRLCLYADTQDEDLWIARHPDREGLTVASGGSGHGFKFGPALGSIIADAVEQKENELLEKFRWRPDVMMDHGREAARCHVDEEGE